jgi:hypothetical protein
MPKVLKLTNLLVATVVGVVVCFNSMTARGSQYELDLKSSLEQKIYGVIRQLDENATVSVDLQFETSKGIELPGTPFILQELNIQDNSSNRKIKSVLVTVYSQIPSLSPTVQQAVKSFASSYARETKISLMPQLVEPRSEVDPKSNTKADPQKGGENRLPQEEKRLVDHASRASIWILVAAMLSLVYLVWQGLRNARSHSSSLRDGFQQLAAAIGDSSASNFQKEKSHDSALESKIPTSLQTDYDTDSSIISGMNASSIQAILSDCYWTGSDDIASYVWRQIPIERREEVLQSPIFMSDYVAFAASVNQAPSDIAQNPYYLSPLDINHLDQEALTTIVRQEPQIFFALSPLRRNQLTLSPIELINLTMINEETSRNQRRDSFQSVPQSKARVLNRNLTIQIASIEAEEELLALKNLDLETKSRVHSLAWLTELPTETVSRILKDFSAKDLCEAWIAPKHILTALEACIPKRKLDLMRSYESKVVPSRLSPTFIEMHLRSIQELSLVAKGDSGKTDKGHLAA